MSDSPDPPGRRLTFGLIRPGGTRGTGFPIVGGVRVAGSTTSLYPLLRGRVLFHYLHRSCDNLYDVT